MFEISRFLWSCIFKSCCSENSSFTLGRSCCLMPPEVGKLKLFMYLFQCGQYFNPGGKAKFMIFIVHGWILYLFYQHNLIVYNLVFFALFMYLSTSLIIKKFFVHVFLCLCCLYKSLQGMWLDPSSSKG